MATISGDALVKAGRNWSMSNGTSIHAGGGQLTGQAVTGTIELGQVISVHVALAAGDSITDANAGSLNIDALTLSLRATSGSIGGPGSAAIDTQVSILSAAASAGIAVEELDGLTVAHVAGVSVHVDAVEQVLFSGTRTQVGESQTQGQLDDLTTTSNGDILLQSQDGLITLNDGLDNDALVVVANGSGNILIQTLASGGDVIVHSGIQSSTGHLTIIAADDADLNGGLTTGGMGSIVVLAEDGTASDAIGSADGISIDAAIQSVDGDVLIRSARDLRQTAEMISQSGNIGIIAAGEIAQTATGDVTATAGDILVEAGRNWFMSDGTEIFAGGGEFHGKALAGDLTLGEIRAAHVALSASGSISDVNAAGMNVQGSTLSIRSTNGSVGQAHPSSLSSGLNGNAIDTQVTTLAVESATGIYIEEVDSLVIDDVAAVTVDVSDLRQILFNGTTRTVAENRSTASLNDLTTTNHGVVKVLARSGTLIVHQGSNGGSGVSANGTGDVLLMAEGTGSDVILNADILATTGHITIDAARSVVVEDDIVTAGNGSVLIRTGSGSVILNDADGNGIGVQSVGGDMLIDAATSVSINAELRTISGSAAIRCGNDLIQTANISLGGDLLIISARDVAMNEMISTQVDGGALIIEAGRDVSVSLVAAADVSVEAGRNVVDARISTQTNFKATSLRIVAGGEIGGANPGLPGGMNLSAIGTEVDTLAAQAADGLVIHEVAAGGTVTIDHVADVSISVNVFRVNFNSTTTSVGSSETLTGLSDLTITANGDLLLLADDGTITLNDGSSVVSGTNGVAVSLAGTGKALIEASGSMSDIVLNADLASTGGHVTLAADDDIRINADVRTAGSGTIFVTASNRESSDLNAISMQHGSAVTTADGNVRLLADRDGTILLSRINAGTGSVSLLAEGSILDGNGGDLNIIADRLRMIADALLTSGADGSGMIGGADSALSNFNVNAIDIEVNVFAAASAEGVFVHEQDGLRIDSTGDISVHRVRFNSTLETQTDADLSDLTTTSDGTIRLQSATGSVTLNDGSDGDSNAITAHGAGDVLIQTLAADGDIVVNAKVRSDSGHVTLSSADDVFIKAAIQTGASGTIVILAESGTDDASAGSTDGLRVDGTITSAGGDILLNADRDIWSNSLVHSMSGDIGLITGRDILQTNAGDITTVHGNILVDAERHWTMSTGTVVSAVNGDLIGQTRTGSISIGEISTINLALSAGADIIDVNSGARNIFAHASSIRAGQMIGTATDYIETELVTLSSRSGSGIFISEANRLTIDSVSALTVTVDDVERADFNGSATAVPESRSLATLSDLSTTNNGSIHVRCEAGPITIHGGTDTIGVSAHGSGDVGLEARGLTSDVTLNARVFSESGHIVVISDRDIVQNDDGDIQTSNADVLINAQRDWMMMSDAEIEAIHGAIGGLTRTGEISLGRLTATTVVLQSARSVFDANGTRLNIAATDFGVSANESIGDRNNSGVTPTGTADALDIDVTTLAASAHHGVFINELNSLRIGQTAGSTIAGTSFSGLSGITSDHSDIFLSVGENLTINESVTAGTADLRILAAGSVSQTAGGRIVADEFGLQQRSTADGHILLRSDNDVNVIAASNAFDGGDLAFSDTDHLIIRSVSTQTVGHLSFSSANGLAATGGDVQIRAQGDIEILRSITSRNGVVDGSSASGESIRIESIDGNILIDAAVGAIVISTDEGPGSHAVTGDVVTLLADSDRSYNNDLDGDSILDVNDADMDGDGTPNSLDSVVDGTVEGKVTVLGDVIISSDGGVARKFGPRPAVGESSTAFFIFSSSPLPVVLDNSPAFWNGANAYVDAFGIEIGVAGEENLTVDIDWRDPASEPGIRSDSGLQLLAQSLGIDNPVSSQRYQQFLIASGGLMNEIGHVYTTADMTLFQKVLNLTTIVIDLSVSHHASLHVSGAFIEQSGTGQSVPGFDVTSTDNPSNGFGNFENGVAAFRIPTVTPAPPALFAAESTARVDRPIIIAPPENTVVFTSLIVGDLSGGAVSGTAFATEVYFQIRRQFEVDGPAEVVVERITDSRLISSREALEKFVDQHPELQDGAGYAIWLISETGGQKIERPVVEFEITGGKTGPANETDRNSVEPPKLIDVPFEQPDGSEEALPKADLPGAAQAKPMIHAPGTELMDVGNQSGGLESEETISRTLPVDGMHEHISEAEMSTPEMDDEDDRQPPEPAAQPQVVSSLLAMGTVAGISITRFRQRQQTDQQPHRYSRAARFRRRHADS
ncbi:MAG: beta strand repeat-containing protein [Planctomycetota bacterium]